MAHRHHIAFEENSSAEGIGCSRVPNGLQMAGETVAEGMGGGFVVAAGKDGTVGGDDAAGPETVTGTAAGTVEMV